MKTVYFLPLSPSVIHTKILSRFNAKTSRFILSIQANRFVPFNRLNIFRRPQAV
ncbi:hypothetical protein NEIELOOT_00083 [Neisseria elongata subsp. glycolytica ATCC 29315]|uniref:Uncharacterized protein n=1 Tax=Neisseria elongata subsp. glycolytica ATCC 29315 TaxID=546263 RepID=D4DM23_NEIEG|nr:hypothetical protein NEIELOOT_00083 [Neisseria elongata subsp. glycolytica ATCC 29315]